MPDSCCVPSCTERRGKGKNLSFFTIPTLKKNPKRRALWISAINREGWEERSIKWARICGKHFHSGRPSANPLNPDYVPSLFGSDATKQDLSSTSEKNNKRPSVIDSVNNENANKVVILSDDITYCNNNDGSDDQNYHEDINDILPIKVKSKRKFYTPRRHPKYDHHS